MNTAFSVARRPAAEAELWLIGGWKTRLWPIRYVGMAGEVSIGVKIGTWCKNGEHEIVIYGET